MLNDHDEYQLHNWSRLPNWRVETARRLVRNEGSDDSVPSLTSAHTTTNGQTELSQSTENQSLERTAICAALDIYETGGEVKGEIEARLLAGEPDADIAARFKLDAPTIAAYEMFCFNVRDRLQARDWILVRVIGTTFQANDNAGVWKYFAYFGGLSVLELVLSVTKKQPLPREVTDTFHIDPVYEEARLRLVTALNVAILQATTCSEVSQLLNLYEKARSMERQRTDIPSILTSELRKYGEFLRFASRTAFSSLVQPSDQEVGQEPERYPAPSATTQESQDEQVGQPRRNSWPIQEKGNLARLM